MNERGGARAADRGPATAAVLRVLADLAATRRRPTYEVPHAGPTPLAWIGAATSTGVGGPAQVLAGTTEVMAVPSTPEVLALQRHDALSPGIDGLRLGWLWITGTAVVEGEEQRILLPLLARPVQIAQIITRRSAVTTGPWDLWHLVADADRAADLEARAQFGGGAIVPGISDELVGRLTYLRNWVDEVVAAAGLPPVARLLGVVDPTEVPVADGLVAVLGFGIYADAEIDPSHPRATLTAWSIDRRASATALAELYVPDGRPAPPAPPAEARADLASPLPLTDRQAAVVLTARDRPVTVVSGPPGTGKSQTAAAVALDTVARGQSVLVATASAAAADVLAELLDRVPGPTPVLFGGGQRAGALAAKLADGVLAPAAPTAAADLAAVEHRAAELEAAVEARLDGAQAQVAWQERSLALPAHIGSAPVLFAVDAPPGTTVPEAVRLLAATEGGPGWWARRTRRRAEARLRALVGAPADVDLAAIGAAVDLATVRDRARRALVADGSVAARWRAVEVVDGERRIGRARALAQQVGQQAEGDARRAVAALATALRAGRATRRAHLARIDVADLTRALPLWVGTLSDIEALLPATAAAFDLVILDEASQIDQLAAAGALLRARRAVVIGDPRQLRFVSFLADDAVRAAVDAQAAWPLADRLDVRRVSAFDLAASSAPVTFLDEHFRSVPHLIGFSAERFYEGRLLVATRHPRNEQALAIEVRQVAGERGGDGTNRAEVAAAVAEVEAALADPATTVGVISPYRPQVDALREAIGARIPIEVLQTGRVRVATVHGFQGGESDVVVASFGLSEAGGRRRRFLEDPHLFNVLVTRARHRLVVLSSVDDPPPGLLADYLRWAVTPPSPLPDGPPADDWTASLVEVLRDRGVPTRTGYRAGTHLLDLVLGTGAECLAVTTRVHPDGPAAHVHRHLALARLGWRQAEALPTDHDGDPVASALALADLLANVPGASSLRRPPPP